MVITLLSVMMKEVVTSSRMGLVIVCIRAISTKESLDIVEAGNVGRVCLQIW